MMPGSSRPFTASSCVHSNAFMPAWPSTRSAAKYSSTVPNSASAMPTPHRMKYFQAASRLALVR